MTATFPLHSCRMFASRLLGDDRFGRRGKPVDENRPGLRTTIKTDAAPRTTLSRVARRMHAIVAQLRGKFQTLGGTRFDAQTASFALLEIHFDVAACRTGHLLSPRCP